MKEDKLGNLSMELSVEVLKLTKELRSKHETVISNQIGRSANTLSPKRRAKYRKALNL